MATATRKVPAARRVASGARDASYDEAEHAARPVYDGAGSARFEPRAAEERQVGAV
jgi:hypothetical protein